MKILQKRRNKKEMSSKENKELKQQNTYFPAILNIQDIGEIHLLVLHEDNKKFMTFIKTIVPEDSIFKKDIVE